MPRKLDSQALRAQGSKTVRRSVSLPEGKVARSAESSAEALRRRNPPPSYAPRRDRQARPSSAAVSSSSSSPKVIPHRLKGMPTGAAKVRPASEPKSVPNGRSPMRSPRQIQSGGQGEYGQPGVTNRRVERPLLREAESTSRSQLSSRPVRQARAMTSKRIPFHGVARIMALICLLMILMWPVGLLLWASAQIKHVDALSGAPDTPGTTYLIAGSDKREEGTPVMDDTEGERSDTIMVLHKARNGRAVLLSIPRDSWVKIPGYGQGKINSAYSYGGEKLLVKTVEELTGLTVDHFVEVGMGGVTRVVDAIGGVELCLDYDVSDEKSELEWKAGCHVSDGTTALAFSRMRYSDPEGDIGRARRQREVVQATMKKAISPSTFIQPWRQVDLASAGASSIVTDLDTGALTLAWMLLALRSATNEGLTGTPPISNVDFEIGGQSAVELDPDLSEEFFQKLRDGELSATELQANTAQ